MRSGQRAAHCEPCAKRVNEVAQDLLARDRVAVHVLVVQVLDRLCDDFRAAFRRGAGNDARGEVVRDGLRRAFAHELRQAGAKLAAQNVQR